MKANLTDVAWWQLALYGFAVTMLNNIIISWLR